MESGKTEEPEVGTDVKEHHLGCGAFDKSVELFCLLRVGVLQMVSEVINPRMADERKARAHLDDLIRTCRVFEFIPKPLCRPRWRSEPVTHAAWNDGS